MTISKEELKKRFGRKDYEVSLFKEKGFVRKQCKICGTNFWTLDPDRETCGDTRCVGGYQFLGKKGRNLNFDEAIKSLTDFFVRHGHTAIRDYPVVARWREDMEFTIASIADFQPWVLEGVIDPPANPLVVPQFCIRTGGEFSDIDNIGKTARHLTGFVMFGQHSFNSSRLKGGYWMDRCIELNFKYLTEELLLKPEEITYAEGIWAGGGNFGPNLEAFAFGSELVNNVFIAYGFQNGSVKELEMRVIDVGWGLERIAWFSQGTPTIYEAIFPKAIKYLQKENDYRIDKDMLIKYSVLAGQLAVDEISNLREARKDMAKKLGMTFEEFERVFGPQEAFYAIADHARTLSIAISDGAIPSNVGGGYNLRMLLRRILALKDLYHLEFSIEKLFKLQIDHLSVSYPRVKNNTDSILAIVDLEVKRYYDTKRTGQKVVKQLLKKKQELDMRTLVDLYQTKGINPLMVKEIAKENNMHVEVPEDFYLKLQEYLQPQTKKEQEHKKPEIELKNDLETYPLYYDDVYATKFEAKVLENIDNKYLILDKTLFYPTGGGQIHDTGVIRYAKKEYHVIDVFKSGQAIVHRIKEKCDIKPHTKIEGEIDGKRRMAIMRHHTAVHVVNNAARTVLGDHVWQAGADKNEERARLDITHYKSITFEELQKIEYLANQIVFQKVPIKKEDLERDKAEQQYGFSIYQGGVVPGKTLHIVSIENWDIEACGGTHLDNTGDIGIIKLIGSERIQDGVVRLEILAGEPALKYIQQQDKILYESASILNVEPKKLPETVQRFFKEWKQQKKTIENLNKKIAQIQFSGTSLKAEKINDIELIVQEATGEQKELILQATQAVKNAEKRLCILVSEANGKIVIVGAKSKGLEFNMAQAIKELSAIVGGSGGGRGDIAIGGGPDSSKKENVLKKVKEVVTKLL